VRNACDGTGGYCVAAIGKESCGVGSSINREGRRREQSRLGLARGDYPVRPNPSNSIVGFIGNLQVSCRIDRNPMGIIESGADCRSTIAGKYL